MLAEDGLCKIGHLADVNLGAGEHSLDFGDYLPHLVCCGWPGIVSCMYKCQPRAVLPSFGWIHAAAVTRREHGQHARAVGTLPPEQGGHLYHLVGGIGAEVEKFHAGIGQ